MNRLTAKNITHYLLSRGFLNPESVLKGDLKINALQSRNSNYKVATGETTGLFVKQLTQDDPQNTYLMQKDATVHYLLHHFEAYKETAKHIPNYYGYDPQVKVLTIAYYVDAQNLHEVIHTTESKVLAEKYIHQAAKIMASFHKVSVEDVMNVPSARFLHQQLPWAFNWDARFTEGNHHYTQFIRDQKEILHTINQLRDEWEIKSLVHGDIKWVNFVVDNASDHVKLIDWEIADFGDPLWDVAGMFQSFLTQWTFTFDDKTTDHKPLKGLEMFTIEKAIDGLLSFWKCYKKEIQLEASREEEVLTKVIRYTGVRMIQTAFELSSMQHKILPNTMRITQMATLFLTEPEQQIEKLFNPESAFS